MQESALVSQNFGALLSNTVQPQPYGPHGNRCLPCRGNVIGPPSSYYSADVPGLPEPVWINCRCSFHSEAERWQCVEVVTMQVLGTYAGSKLPRDMPRLDQIGNVDSIVGRTVATTMARINSHLKWANVPTMIACFFFVYRLLRVRGPPIPHFSLLGFLILLLTHGSIIAVAPIPNGRILRRCSGNITTNTGSAAVRASHSH